MTRRFSSCGATPSCRGFRIGSHIVTASRIVMASAVLIGCGNDDQVSYTRDIAPLLARRCVPCHNSAGQGGRRDLEDPFTLDDNSPGMFVATNDWGDAAPEQSPAYNVVPYHPEQSFLLEKITNLNLLPENYDDARCKQLVADPSVPLPPECRAYYAGSFMPLQQTVADGDIASIRQWISDGAKDDDFFEKSVAPLFGDPSTYLAGPCGYCHYPGGPQTPDFTHPFDPVVGIVNVNAHYRADLELVAPGDPDASFLIMKLEMIKKLETDPPGNVSEAAQCGVVDEAATLRSCLGAPMPRNYEALSAEQAALVERWIAEGAKNN